MREFVAKTGGRYTYIEDFNALQELTVSLLTLFDGCNNFILSGCETSGSTLSNTKIEEGYVYINNKIRKFDGATVNLNNPYYIVESERTESGSYAQNATQQICTYYECYGTTEKPTDKQYIELKSTYIPRLKDEFFGKYALLLDASTPNQEINKTAIFKQNLEVRNEMISDGTIIKRNPNTSSMLKIAGEADGSCRIIYHSGGEDLSYVAFDTDGNIRFSIGGEDRFSVMSTNTAVDVLRANSMQTDEIIVYDNNIENYADTTGSGSVNVNKSGYQGGTTLSRSFKVYDGQGKVLFETDGAAKRIIARTNLVEDSDEQYSYTLKSSKYLYNAPDYAKMIRWWDSNEFMLAYLGFTTGLNSGKKDFVIHNTAGAISLEAEKINISGTLTENGVNYSSKFIDKAYVDEALAKKVDKVSGQGLSDENFTSAYKAQLDSLKKGSISSGDQGMVSGNDVAQGLANKLDKDLSGVNAEAGRNNLNVYSKEQCDNSYAKKDLSNVRGLTTEQQAAARAAIGAAASSMQAELDGMEQKINQMISDYCDKRFVGMTDGQTLLISRKESVGGLQFIQKGSIVCVMGTINGLGGVSNRNWFNIPNSIGAPAYDIGGTFLYDTNNDDGRVATVVNGIVWKCQSGSRNVMAVSSSTQTSQPITICITYITNSQ